ncbi:MAG TPA: diguanylate cyclase [Myxococcota bacterium]|nr:diguanylate cyclase [Myxococcota bacterium]HRY93787.1 diguanylate cyclase [Myxococcota bacterium]HSA20471.1 diguanylate cyclase [Myxococcota bacterium]
MKTSLAAKLIASFLGASLIGAVTVWWVSASQEDRVVHAELTNNSRVLVSTIDYGLTAAMLAGDKEVARQLVRDMASLDPIARIAVYDADGQVWFDTGRGQPVLQTVDAGRLRELAASGGEALEIARTGRGEVLEAVSPIRGRQACAQCHGQQENLGLVAVVLSAEPTRARLAEDRRSLLWSSLGAGLASLAVLGALLAALVARRFRRLSARLEDTSHDLDRTRVLAVTDGLTGLANHRHFHERLADELERARRFGHPLALIMLDLDHFKALNDRYGHLAGNAVLAELARTLLGLARKEDLVARYGGEEFAVVLLESRLEQAAAFAERLRLAVEQARPGRVFDPELAVTISAGVASYPDQATGAEALIVAADRALYAAKAAGRNRVRVARRKVDCAGPLSTLQDPC